MKRPSVGAKGDVKRPSIGVEGGIMVGAGDEGCHARPDRASADVDL